VHDTALERNRSLTGHSIDEAPLVSVVIPCRNAGQHLERQLGALASQETSFPWELVVVDNGSSDDSMRIVEAYEDRLRLRVASAPDRANQAYARNVGAEAAHAEKLVFVDADDEVAPGFLASMFASLRAHDFVAVPRDVDALNPEWTRHAHSVTESSFGTFAPFAFGSAIGLSRRAFDSVSGCPEEYDACWDMALSYRLQQSGVALVFLAEPLLRYRFRCSIRRLFGQTRVWGYYEALVYRDFGPAFVARRSARLALSEWLGALGDLATARSRADVARSAVRLGYSAGRFQGSMRHRVFYP
jgi:glycosyltransferase involved in cell wall biosynthesis